MIEEARIEMESVCERDEKLTSIVRLWDKPLVSYLRNVPLTLCVAVVFAERPATIFRFGFARFLFLRRTKCCVAAAGSHLIFTNWRKYNIFRT